MSEEVTDAVVEIAPLSAPKARTKPKRDIIRFNGEKPTAINLEHATSIYLEGNKITFEFYTKAQFVEFENDAAAASAFEVLLNTWAADVEIKGSGNEE